MKKRNLKVLKLNKNSISNMETLTIGGGRWTNQSICDCATEVHCGSNGSCAHQECEATTPDGSTC